MTTIAWRLAQLIVGFAETNAKRGRLDEFDAVGLGCTGV